MKQRKSKLDSFADKIAEWFGREKLTLDQARARLEQLGCVVSAGRLSVWWEAWQSRELQERLLGQIANGASQVKQVEKEFSKNAAPELEMLIKLHRVLILKLSTQANVDPKMLQFVSGLMRDAMDFAKLQEKQADRKLATEKFQFDATKAALEQLPALRKISADPSLDAGEKLNRARLALFGELPA